MGPFESLKPFLDQASAEGSRTTALGPLVWLAGLLLSATVISAAASPAVWLTILLSMLTSASVIFYIYAYFHFMKTNPDALRFEKYSLHKSIIEKGLTGDSVTGTISHSTDSSLLQLGPAKEIGSGIPKLEDNGS